jgi:hypothetical protein
MTDREKLLIALLTESDRRAGAAMSVVEVVALLEKIGTAQRLALHHKSVATVA